jgi:hypothetical protein
MEISQLFSSKARFQVLQVLSLVEWPVSLRTLERLTGLPIRSVKLATLDLVKKKILFQKKQKNSILFSLNRDHFFMDVLKEIFALISRDSIRRRSVSYQSRAADILRFSDEVRLLVKRSK